MVADFKIKQNVFKFHPDAEKHGQGMRPGAAYGLPQICLFKDGQKEPNLFFISGIEQKRTHISDHFLDIRSFADGPHPFA